MKSNPRGIINAPPDCNTSQSCMDLATDACRIEIVIGLIYVLLLKMQQYF